MKRWQWGVSEAPEPGQVRAEVTIVSGEAEARRLVAEGWPSVQMYRRPEPKPWSLVPVTSKPEA